MQTAQTNSVVNPREVKGFTLVELLVVIAIIAILATVGFAIFNGIQKNARDARRKADIDAMAKAMEVKKDGNTSTYGQLQHVDFSNGAIPTDTSTAKYVVAVVTTAGGTLPLPPSNWAVTSATPTSPAGYGIVDGSTNPANNSYAWRFCALLENGTNPTVYCRANAQ